jgi:BMFP domain-containing protein YqiC
MLKRILPLLAVLAVAVPAAALAGGGSGDRATAIGDRLDARFDRFASHCLVDNAPPRCAEVAARILHRLDALEARIDNLKARIHERCSQASPPERCAHAADVVARLDALKAKLEGFESRIRAKYPG